MESKGDEFIFLGDKIGMLFNIHDGRVSVIGLDSTQYQQTSQPLAPPASTNTEETDEDDNLNQKYKDVISLTPSGPILEQNEDAEVPVVKKEEEKSATSPTLPEQEHIAENPSEKETTDSTTLLPNEIISALANLEDVPNVIDVKSEEQLSAEVPGGNINHLPSAPTDDNTVGCDNNLPTTNLEDVSLFCYVLFLNFSFLFMLNQM